MSAMEDVAQSQLHFVDDMQHDDEVIRPIVLFAEPLAARSRQTGSEPTVVGAKAHRVAMQGMRGLVEQRLVNPGRKGQVYPEAVAAHSLYVTQLSPPLHDREIVRIVQRTFGSKTHHHTVQHCLERWALKATVVQLALHLLAFSAFADAYHRALDGRPHVLLAGWNPQLSIAGCLQMARSHGYAIMAAFERDGFEGLEDQRTRPSPHPDDQLTLPCLKDVLDLQQEYPRAGRWRLPGLLEQQYGPDLPSASTVGRAIAINRRGHGAPGPWPRARDAQAVVAEPRPVPYRPHYRHHLWLVDMRYLVKLDGRWVYSVWILEGSSRMILAGMASEHHDLPALLPLLFAALSAYGCPEAIVSDHGAVFRADDDVALRKALEIEPPDIELRKPWQTLIEAQLKGHLRRADFTFEQAGTVEERQR